MHTLLRQSVTDAASQSTLPPYKGNCAPEVHGFLLTADRGRFEPFPVSLDSLLPDRRPGQAVEGQDPAIGQPSRRSESREPEMAGQPRRSRAARGAASSSVPREHGVGIRSTARRDAAAGELAELGDHVVRACEAVLAAERCFGLSLQPDAVAQHASTRTMGAERLCQGSDGRISRTSTRRETADTLWVPGPGLGELATNTSPSRARIARSMAVAVPRSGPAASTASRLVDRHREPCTTMRSIWVWPKGCAPDCCAANPMSYGCCRRRR